MSDATWDDLCDNCLMNPKRPRGRECEACSKYRQRHNNQPRPMYLADREMSQRPGTVDP